MVREAPWEGPPGRGPGAGPQGDIQSCRPARLEGIREAGDLRPRLAAVPVPLFEDHTSDRGGRGKAGRPRSLLCYSIPKATVTQPGR